MFLSQRLSDKEGERQIVGEERRGEERRGEERRGEEYVLEYR